MHDDGSRDRGKISNLERRRGSSIAMAASLFSNQTKLMKYLIIILFLATCSFAQAQTTVLTTDPSLPIPKLSFDEKGDLKITSSATSSPSDFDFLVGKWKMHNRRLNKRLENCKDWTEFDSLDENSKTLSGTADMDIYSTT